MNKIFALVSTVAALGLTACANPTPPVSHQGPARLDAEMKTYAVLDHPVGKSLSTNHEFQQRIHGAMARKGYAPAPKDRADVLVSFKALVMPEDGSVRTLASRDTGGDDETVTGNSSSAADVRKVVMVLLEEAKTDRVMWVGWSATEVSDYEVVRMTRESLDEILARIPPRG